MTTIETAQDRLRLQVRRLPLQCLHLPELRLLNGAGRAGKGAARFRVMDDLGPYCLGSATSFGQYP